MGYPNLPKNRLIVNGVDLTAEFLMILADGYKLEPPEPKVYTVDIPGGDGNLDLTESLFGDTAYNNRNQEFIFYIIATENFERVKTQVTNFLHGKSYDYEITMDPGYTYHGRFKVTEYTHSVHPIGTIGAIKITVDAKPYKSKGIKTYKVNANGGHVYRFESGRKRVQPTFECSNPTTIGFKGMEFTLPQGTYKSPHVWFELGWNEIYINSMRVDSTTWDEIGQGGSKAMTWDQIDKLRWFEVSKLGLPENVVGMSWDDLADYRWNDLASKTWNDICYTDAGGRKFTTYVSYEWSDL